MTPDRIPLPTIVIGVSLILLIVLWILALVSFPKDTPAAILHYSVGVGIDFIGESRQIFILPAIGSVVFLFNMVLWKLIQPASAQAAWTLLGATPLIQIILLTAYMLLWNLN